MTARGLVDSFARRVTYLRISLTDRCNYRCLYCFPQEGALHAPKSDVLTIEEIERLVRCLAPLGVTRVRLTGGEPTIRRGLVDLVDRLANHCGVEVCMTTNGELLSELAIPLRQAGLSSINVSLDSLDEVRFRAITRHGNLSAVLRGIEAAIEAGFSRLKLNTVVMRHQNDEELADLCRYAWSRKAIPRFIELMPMGDGDTFDPRFFVSAAETRERLEAALDVALHPVAATHGAGPARYWRLGPSESQVGFISALTENFCATCNRIRLSAKGELHTCLARDETLSIRNLMRSGACDQEIVDSVRLALAEKRQEHAFEMTGCGAPRKPMVAIGG